VSGSNGDGSTHGLFRGEARGDERAGIEGGLDDEATAGKTRDEGGCAGENFPVGGVRAGIRTRARRATGFSPASGSLDAGNDVDGPCPAGWWTLAPPVRRRVRGAVHTDSQAAYDDQPAR